MNEMHWQQVWPIFEEASDRPPEKQQAFLDEACGQDEKLRRAVEGMLAADLESDTLLDHPVGPRAGAKPRDAEAQTPLPRGAAVGPYRVLRRIGQGGMSTVYLAERADDVFPRRVAVKLVRPGMRSATILSRLRTERRILASLDHPSIARLYDGGNVDGQPYFVMEYVEGVPIDAYCRQNRLSVDERLTLFRKVCAAVQAAHRNLVVHRDVKPSNILVTAEGEPKLLDFGIAKLLNPDLVASDAEPTATWERLLTPSYASPEQIRGKLVTTASDVYSLGVLLYLLLTGSLPYRFEGRSLDEIERMLIETEPPPPSEAASRPAASEATVEPTLSAQDDGAQDEPRPEKLRRQLSGDLDAIVLKALRSAPHHRYDSVERLAADVERHQNGLPVSARAGTWRYRAGKFVRRNRRAVAAALAVAVLLVGFAAAMALQASRVASERDQARRERDKKAQVLALVLEVFELSNPYVVEGELTVREALHRSVPLLRDGLREQPEVRAELLHSAGRLLRILGEHEISRDQLSEALEIRQRLYGEDHLDVAETMTALSATLVDLGELDDAEELARRALASARGQLGDGHPDLAAPLNQLVSVYCHRDETEAVAEQAERALAMTDELPAGSARRITALEHLARVRTGNGDYGEAAKILREALALRRIRFGERHPDQLATLNNLGLALRRMEDLEGAETTYQEALSLGREIFGESYFDPYLFNNLAAVRFALEDYDGAGSLFREMRQGLLRSSGPRHWMVFSTDVWIERTRLRQGEAAQAEESLRRLLEEWRSEMGERFLFEVARSILGMSVSLQGRCAEAEPLLVDSFERLLERARHRYRSDAFERLRGHLERCGQPQEIARYQARLEASGE